VGGRFLASLLFRPFLSLLIQLHRKRIEKPKSLLRYQNMSACYSYLLSFVSMYFVYDTHWQNGTLSWWNQPCYRQQRSLSPIISGQDTCRLTYTQHLWRQECRCRWSASVQQSSVSVATGHQLRTIQTSTDNISVTTHLLTTTHRGCLLTCAF